MNQSNPLRSLVARAVSARRFVLSVTVMFGALGMGLGGPVYAQTSADSPFVSAKAADYPDGSRLKPNYRAGQGQLQIPRARGPSKEAAIGFAAAASGQAQLPPGFTLQRGTTTRVMDQAYVPSGAAPRDAAPGDGKAATGTSQVKYFALYPMEYMGIPLAKGSDFLAVVNEDGGVLATRERSIPTEVNATVSSVSADAALEAARHAAGAGLSEADAKASTPKLEIWVDEQLKGHLAWVITLESKSRTNPQDRMYWISAVGEPKVLSSESTIYHTHFGTVAGTTWETSPLEPTLSHSLASLTATRTGAGGGTSLTGPDGRYAYVAGLGSATINASLSGPFFVVQNQAGANMTRAATGSPAAAINLNFGGASNAEFAQVTAFYWGNVARNVAGILAPGELASLPTRVNIASSCNAYWNGSSINFFQAGGSCPNTAYSDVVLHEYGHGVDAVKGGILDGGYSEGFGDALAVLGTQQSCLGRDFLGAGTCLRPATDLILWPPVSGEGVHAIGRRYAGFTWELVQQLKKTYSDEESFWLATRLVMAAAAANPSSIPDAVHLSFVADDTDGNLTTCSPHFKELAAAADSRHIPRPADCVSSADAGVRASSAQFPWTPSIKVSTNSNIATATITLPTPMALHIVANTSARALGTTPVTFNTGFYNQSNPATMWTNSYRSVTIPGANQWMNFSSTFAITLPAGTHQIYWKIWTGSQLEFSGGSLLVEAFGGTASLTGFGDSGQESTGFEPLKQNLIDNQGQPITTIRE